MYAVMVTGGKQYRWLRGYLKVEKLVAQEGETVQFDNLLMVADGENIQLVRRIWRVPRSRRQ